MQKPHGSRPEEKEAGPTRRSRQIRLNRFSGGCTSPYETRLARLQYYAACRGAARRQRKASAIENHFRQFGRAHYCEARAQDCRFRARPRNDEELGQGCNVHEFAAPSGTLQSKAAPSRTSSASAFRNTSDPSGSVVHTDSPVDVTIACMSSGPCKMQAITPINHAIKTAAATRRVHRKERTVSGHSTVSRHLSVSVEDVHLAPCHSQSPSTSLTGGRNVIHRAYFRAQR